LVLSFLLTGGIICLLKFSILKIYTIRLKYIHIFPSFSLWVSWSWNLWSCSITRRCVGLILWFSGLCYGYLGISQFASRMSEVLLREDYSLLLVVTFPSKVGIVLKAFWHACQTLHFSPAAAPSRNFFWSTRIGFVHRLTQEGSYTFIFPPFILGVGIKFRWNSDGFSKSSSYAFSPRTASTTL
jgi:hypothetical protein